MVPQSIYHIAQTQNLKPFDEDNPRIRRYKLTIGIRGSHYINISLYGYGIVILYLWLTFISFLMFVTGWPRSSSLSPPFVISFYCHSNLYKKFPLSFSSLLSGSFWALPIVNIFFHYFPLVFTRLLHSLATYLCVCLFRACLSWIWLCTGRKG